MGGATILAAETLPTRGPLPFSTYDSDNNNVITVKEFNVIKEQRRVQQYQQGKLMRNAVNFSDIDTNSDEIITQTELKVHQDKRFANRMNQKCKHARWKRYGNGTRSKLVKLLLEERNSLFHNSSSNC